MSIEGIWTTEVYGAFGWENRGVFVLENGRILIEGRDVWQLEDGARRRMLQRVGVTYQGGALFGSMTLLENVRLPLDVHTSLPMRSVRAARTLRTRSSQNCRSAWGSPTDRETHQTGIDSSKTTGGA